MTLKKLILQIHLWLGLATGLVVFVMGLTGAIYCFQPELSKLITQPYLKVQAQDKPFLPVSEYKRIAEAQLPGKKPTRILIKGPETAVIVQFSGKKPKPFSYAVFLDPYTGEVLKSRDMNSEFFRWILNGHMYLWLPQPIGKAITGASTLIFLVMVVSGIVLWWPRNKARRKSSFKVKWSASPKRLNYDLHNVFGFYASWVLIFTIITGLYWSYEFTSKATYWAFSGGETKPKPPVLKSVKMPLADSSMQPLDKIFNQVTASFPAAKGFQVNIPQTDSAVVLVRAYPDLKTYYQSDNVYFDQYSAKEIPVNFLGRYADANAGEKAVRMNYDIHVGAIAGLPGRILMFFISLIAASLPVTGFYIWWGKKKKKPAAKTQPALRKQTELQPA
ncbi:PepSY-associated TM helix domain-containing protein [Pseudoflavitalea rhizosphaerae]|uniref:PepSY-associated TM helix domain-containing protein n=1 Tax=Pseudoflavitalea rhizosphaerae TaxID=1884793 RepID=UPI000F8ED9C6|nr:PepSY-associated TM helix domain-containing protein [Pseudoflavitalea rhizosphaerae]